ncbi:PH domain-containing protein [Sutcliffiella horikoshii]|uniref:PH domain-containing protein n=1 Tax=Sutcliffiella horikoshii TaxID=79883 RepID=A0A5D4SNP9_9BACI|nr:PH domain-containing protein [Sutcliffiella horikoshii]TYS64649.1 PH domain-containing protein [Sutcliffiella horikoshii]
MMSDKKRMHPAAIVVAFFKQLRELLFPIIIFLFFGSSSGEGFFSIIYIAVMVLWFAGLIAIGVVSWYRFYYWIEDGELRMEYGVFVKKRRFIPQERIQTLDTSEGIIQRIFGLVKVQIETAGGGTEAEASLTAVTKHEASRLREALLYYKNKDENVDVYGPKLPVQQEPSSEPIEKPTYKASWKTLFIVGTTSGGIGVVLSAVIAFTSQFDQFVPYEDIIDRFGMVLQTSVYLIASIVFVVLLVSWLISIVMTMFKYGNFTVTKQDDELLISRGIIEKRQLTISLKKIQAIRISQNLLRQPFGYVTVYVESAGSSGGKESDFSTILFPLLKVSEVEAHLKEFVPSYLLAQEVHGLPKRSVIRYLIRLMVPATLLSIPIAYFFQPYGYLAFLSVAVAGLLGYSQYKAAGWAMESEQLQLSYRHLSKNTVLVRKKRIQSFELRESFFQGKRKLFTIKAAIKTGLGGKNFQVVDVEQLDGEQIYEWYSYEKKQGDVM